MTELGELVSNHGRDGEHPPELPGTNEERSGRVTWIAVLGALAALVVLTFVNPWVFTADDSLFYLVIARHISAEGSWTFNGLMPTNGVQPLWQLAVSAVVAVTELVGIDSPSAVLRALLVLNWALAGTALVQLWRLLGRLGTSDPIRLLGVVMLGCCLCGPWAMFASEAHLVAVTMLWLLLSVERWVREGPSTSTALAAGLAAGLMMLSRLDTVWLAATAVGCLFAAPSAPAGARLRRVLPAVAAATAVVLPYLVWNVARFGHLNPISGAIKIDLRSPQFSIGGIGSFGVAILAVIWAGGAVAVLRSPRRPARVAVWLVPSVGATVGSAFYFAFSRGAFTQWFWYYVPHAVALALTVGLLAARVAEDRPALRVLVVRAARVGAAVLGIASVAFCAIRYVAGPPNAHWDESRTFSSEVAEALPDGEAVAAVDMPGVLAFLSGHPVVALDGLTGDFDFQDRMRDDGVSCTLDALGVGYLVTVKDRGEVARDDESVELALSSWLHREAPSTLQAQDPLLVSPDGDYVLWRLVPGCEPPS